MIDSPDVMNARLDEQQIQETVTWESYAEAIIDMTRSEAERIAEEQGWRVVNHPFGDVLVETMAYMDMDTDDEDGRPISAMMMICVDGSPASFFSC